MASLHREGQSRRSEEYQIAPLGCALGHKRNVRFGSKADIWRRLRDVRFTHQKQTSLGVVSMSAKYQTRTHALQQKARQT